MTILITGATAEARLAEAKKIVGLDSRGVDLMILEDQSGIEEVRVIQKDLSRKPYQSKAISIVLVDAENLSPEAQNALLKTLEEPPGEANLFLLSGYPERLLPTVRSRAQRFDLGPNEESVNPTDLKSAWRLWQSGNRGQLFDVATKAAPQPWAEIARQLLLYCLGGHDLLEKAVRQGRLTDLVGEKDVATVANRLLEGDLVKFLQTAQLASSDLASNVNRRLAMENLLLMLPQDKS